jgi:predicted DNA-binding protein with PD1-like motif
VNALPCPGPLLPLRLHPGQDLRRALEAAVAAQGLQAGYVMQGMGSLRDAQLRLANADVVMPLPGTCEILTLAGSVGADHSHLHASLADEQGRVFGGHLPYGSMVHTTAEVLLALLPGWTFSREPDTTTGYAELHITRLGG